MNKKKCMVKVISAVSAVALTLMLPGGFSGVRKVSAASVSDLEQQVKELEREQQELKNKAAEYSKDLDKQQEAKEALEDPDCQCPFSDQPVVSAGNCHQQSDRGDECHHPAEGTRNCGEAGAD